MIAVTRFGRVVVIGSGGQGYREYVLESAAVHAEVVLLTSEVPSWERPFLTGYRQVDLHDQEALCEAVADCLDNGREPGGVFTWREDLLEITAEVAARLGLVHMRPEQVRECRDKLATRRQTAAAGIPCPRYAQVFQADQALHWAKHTGYPVVVKPRSLAGSSGVRVADNPQELLSAFHHATSADFPGLDPLAGVIVEEYLDGPEISVDSVIRDGSVRCVNVARKRLGYQPCFEEIGHLVCPWQDEPWSAQVRELIKAVHEALKIDNGITHAEVRLTEHGPRLVELNGRLGGDFIPYLGLLATGVDLTAAAVAVALGLEPELTPTRDTCAEVRFLYPPQDSVVRQLELTAAAGVPGVVKAVPLVRPGQTIRLPPRSVAQRLAAIVVTGPDPVACEQTMERAAGLVRAELEPANAVG